MVLKTWLIPLDGSSASRRVLAPVELVIRAQSPQVTLLHVVPEGEPLDPPPGLEASLRDACTLLGEWGATAELKVVAGEAAGAILDEVETSNPSVVAMATHGRSGVTRWVRGSVAERVLRGCSSPLLTVNPTAAADGPHRFGKILVPLDGSELADSVLTDVEHLARIYDAEVVLFRVEPFIPPAIPSPVVQETWDPEVVRKTLEPAATFLRDAGRKVRCEVAYGLEAHEILEAIDREAADLVAMSTHGRSGASRWWFGSVAEQVLRHCSCPLYVKRVRTQP